MWQHPSHSPVGCTRLRSVNVTSHPQSVDRVPQRESEPSGFSAGRFRLAAVFGLHFSDVHAVPLRINALTLSHAFMTLNQLTSQIGRHLLWTVRSQCLQSTEPQPPSVGSALVAQLQCDCTNYDA